ncbi:MAG TPA: cellulase family glycosylhydrolase [Ignavibacteria bacterium]|nr:cellulase family glycosylhydrolase [Ignavibacteria bacterium]HMR39162.1 cellulase family glycosylhydrolase [Ignavibacteria bacterium]
MTDFISSVNGRLYSDGKPFRFIGANMYELANVDSATTELMLRDAADEGFRVVRFWNFHPVSKDKLKEICEFAKAYKLYVIPVLADTTGFLQSFSIDPDWYRSGYKKIFLPYIIEMVSSFQNANEIMLWEIINEPFTESFQDMFNFAKAVSETIRTEDPNHLISIGTIGGIGDKFGNSFSRFSLSGFEKLYSIKTLDAVSLHDYSFGSTLFERLDIYNRLKGKHDTSKKYSSLSDLINYIPDKIDKFTLGSFNKTIDFPLSLRSLWKRYNRMNLASAKNLNKPVYIGEVGFKKSLNEMRKVVMEKELKEYFNADISGVLLWSFESQGKSIDGHDYGFDKKDKFGEVVKIFDLKLM